MYFVKIHITKPYPYSTFSRYSLSIFLNKYWFFQSLPLSGPKHLLFTGTVFCKCGFWFVIFTNITYHIYIKNVCFYYILFWAVPQFKKNHICLIFFELFMFFYVFVWNIKKKKPSQPTASFFWLVFFYFDGTHILNSFHFLPFFLQFFICFFRQIPF